MHTTTWGFVQGLCVRNSWKLNFLNRTDAARIPCSDSVSRVQGYTCVEGGEWVRGGRMDVSGMRDLGRSVIRLRGWGGGWTRERVKLLFFLYAQHSAAPNIRRRVLLAAHVDREIYVWTFYYFPNTSGNPRKRKKITPPHVNSENKKNRFYVNWNENYSKIVLRFYCVHLHIELILFINIGARCTAAQGSPTSARHSSLNQVVDVFFCKELLYMWHVRYNIRFVR